MDYVLCGREARSAYRRRGPSIDRLKTTLAHSKGVAGRARHVDHPSAECSFAYARRRRAPPIGACPGRTNKPLITPRDTSVLIGLAGRNGLELNLDRASSLRSRGRALTHGSACGVRTKMTIGNGTSPRAFAMLWLWIGMLSTFASGSRLPSHNAMQRECSRAAGRGQFARTRLQTNGPSTTGR
jgi:hypothetical protein